jgi:adenylyl-sulfate kinase
MSLAHTLWFTGLSGAGKSTLSVKVADALRKRGEKVEILDGDEVRTNLSQGLTFSKEDRDINVRRIGYVCKLLTRNDVWAVSAAISPYRAGRDFNREMIGRFIEIYVECSIEELSRRDVKGLYKKAIAGEIKNFTGISDPYEPPLKPEITVNSEKESVEQSLEKILTHKKARN